MLSSRDLIEALSAATGMLPAQLELIIRTAPLRYKVFTIPKRNGTRRLVAQPAREVKKIQTWLVQNLRNLLPVHSAATAYEKGTSIKINAARHLNKKYLLKMDLENFFPSIEYRDLCQHLQKYTSDSYDTSAIEMIARLCSWAPNRQPPLRLCIGAPSSPFLSNSILYDFDNFLEKISANDNVIYTRYADDLTFSADSPNTLSTYPEIISKALAALPFPNLIINEKKTVFASRAGLRMITGITLTPTQELSVGRERKRLARSMFHRFCMGRLDEKEVDKMFGLLTFIDHIEPGFSSRLKLRKSDS